MEEPSKSNIYYNNNEEIALADDKEPLEMKRTSSNYFGVCTSPEISKVDSQELILELPIPKKIKFSLAAKEGNKGEKPGNIINTRSYKALLWDRRKDEIGW